jgi:hypothetical protein
MQDKDSYEFQKARVLGLADEIGKQVEFDETTTSIKFRVTEKGGKFRAKPNSGDFLPDLSPSELSDKSDAWLKAFILKLANHEELEEIQFANGDRVRRRDGGTEVFTIIESRSDGLYKLQLGSDGATARYVRGRDLELVAKAAEPDVGPGFYPGRSIME